MEIRLEMIVEDSSLAQEDGQSLSIDEVCASSQTTVGPSSCECLVLVSQRICHKLHATAKHNLLPVMLDFSIGTVDQGVRSSELSANGHDWRLDRLIACDSLVKT